MAPFLGWLRKQNTFGVRPTKLDLSLGIPL